MIVSKNISSGVLFMISGYSPYLHLWILPLAIYYLTGITLLGRFYAQTEPKGEE